jgi:general stress protein YciG
MSNLASENGITALATVRDDPSGIALVRAPAKRGFAAMDRTRQREIASKGGRAAHESGSAHQFSTEEARRAGRLGGRKVSADRAHMAEIGRAGGKARGRAGAEGEASSPATVVSPAAIEVGPPKDQ